MAQKATKLLERMRNSKAGWKRRDLDQLYEAYGFLISHGKSHDIVKHYQFPHLRTTLPRHNQIAKVYVEIAVKLVDQLMVLEKEQADGSMEGS